MIFENPWRAFSNLEILCFAPTGLYTTSADSEILVRDRAWRRLRRIFFQATGYEKRQMDPNPVLKKPEFAASETSVFSDYYHTEAAKLLTCQLQKSGVLLNI